MPITELRIQGLRTIEDIRLKLDGLTVLIGNNGSGKSSIIEACEILRRAGSERFLDDFYNIHGGFAALLRQGAKRLELGLVIHPNRDDLPQDEFLAWSRFGCIEYSLVLDPHEAFASIQEIVRVGKVSEPPARQSKNKRTGRRGAGRAPKLDTVLQRRGTHYERVGSERLKRKTIYYIDEKATVVSQAHGNTAAVAADAVHIIAAYLRNLRVHLPFEVMAAWAARALDRKSVLRTSSVFAPADYLEKLGVNLANAYHALRSTYDHAEWQRTLSYVRLGLGNHIEDVFTWADLGGGQIGLALKLSGLDQRIPSSQLSDGMLSYLAFVALFRLDGSNSSLIALDEPDLHFHPQLLMRVVDMLEEMGRSFPVLVATHSDRLLDGLSDPSRSVVLCELDHNQATRLVRPDPKALAKWLKRYRGLGDIWSAGHEASVLTRKEPA